MDELIAEKLSGWYEDTCFDIKKELKGEMDIEKSKEIFLQLSPSRRAIFEAIMGIEAWFEEKVKECGLIRETGLKGASGAIIERHEKGIAVIQSLDKSDCSYLRKLEAYCIALRAIQVVMYRNDIKPSDNLHERIFAELLVVN